jgi:hypothetical protein
MFEKLTPNETSYFWPQMLFLLGGGITFLCFGMFTTMFFFADADDVAYSDANIYAPFISSCIITGLYIVSVILEVFWIRRTLGDAKELALQGYPESAKDKARNQYLWIGIPHLLLFGLSLALMVMSIIWWNNDGDDTICDGAVNDDNCFKSTDVRRKYLFHLLQVITWVVQTATMLMVVIVLSIMNFSLPSLMESYADKSIVPPGKANQFASARASRYTGPQNGPYQRRAYN